MERGTVTPEDHDRGDDDEPGSQEEGGGVDRKGVVCPALVPDQVIPRHESEGDDHRADADRQRPPSISRARRELGRHTFTVFP
jgi:hypothetical protein